MRGLLGFVAALGITNTLTHLLIRSDLMHRPNSPYLIINLVPVTEAYLELGRSAHFIMAMLQIIIAFRFYQSTMIQLEDRFPPLSKTDAPEKKAKAQANTFAKMAMRQGG
jgi:hypothetical protein